MGARDVSPRGGKRTIALPSLSPQRSGRMPRLSVNSLRTSVVVVLLALAFAGQAAEREGDKRLPLMGASKEEVYSRLGEPRSVMKAGVREVLFFPKVKVTLRNGIVIETEELLEEAPPPPPPVRRAGEPAAAAAVPADTKDVAEAGKTRKAGGAAAPTEAAAAKPVEPPAEVQPAGPTTGNGGLEIKFVRAPLANAPRPTPRASVVPLGTPTTPVPAGTARTGATSAGSSAVRSATGAGPAATAPVVTPAGTPTAVPREPSVENRPVTPAAAAAAAAATAEPKEKPSPRTPEQAFSRRRVAKEVELPEAPLFTLQTFLAAMAAVGGVGYLIWRSRQRALELMATTLSNTPLAEPAAVDTTALFSAEFLAKLEWKRFEELVALYYTKTGVVAVRTKTGPASPVHLQISWKGESKPFACVQCHANPPGLIRVEPLQALASALAAANIRRGYVVTNGKFNVAARDLAEEKHFTLLPGDILLEKLNALPPAARRELMQEITTGDYTTPSCPKCEAKMVRSEPAGWHCANAPKCQGTLPAQKT